ncbi:Rne/Rng family ribonuclease [Candidatus Pelagibacter sp.]|nr:Rne/Rng family ribonuclease [Candidatus Pelagibacter sp.]
MAKNLYIDASHPNETRVVLKSEENIEDYEYESISNSFIKNNIYLGKVSRVEPSLQAAFIDFGRERHGFLSLNDIQSDYYQIPQGDLDIIKEEEEKVREELIKEDKKTEDSIVEENQNLITENNEIAENQDPIEKTPLDNKIEENKKEKRYPTKRYKIQEVIKPNQVILIQVLKDERGLKGAALSTFISIAGKYIVLMPNTPKGGGISRKIFNPADRKKIRKILNEIEIPKEMGLIVRTAGSNKTKNEIENDLNNLIKIWNSIKEKAINSIAPNLIHEESDVIKRSIRDMYDDETQNVIVEGNEGYQKAKNYMKLVMPKNVKKIKKYRDKIPLFFKEKIDSKLFQIFETEVKLKSGGYLVINPTEALVSIDVNSGSSIKQKNVESTALDTNLEAAEEISRQVKLRDLSGLITIDFIDMLNYSNKRLVERRLKDKCRTDRARIQIGRISSFGLLEMSRQRLRESNIRWNLKLSNETFALKIIKLVELKTLENNAKIIKLNLNDKICNFIKESYMDDFNYFKRKNKIEINMFANNSLGLDDYEVEFLSKTNKIIDKIEKISSLKKLEILKPELKNYTIGRKKFKKKKFYKKKSKKS